MPKFTGPEAHAIMTSPERIRNVCLISAMGHGKSTVIDILGAHTGYLGWDKIGTHFTHTRDDEKAKGVSIRTIGASMVIPGPDKKDYLFNMVDSPGHVEFSPEVSAATRMTDSCLVVVDICDGITVQCQQVITTAVKDRLRPILFINKIDRMINEMQKEPEDIYEEMRKVIEDANDAVKNAIPEGEVSYLGDLKKEENTVFDPRAGNVLFGSAIGGWAFQMSKFSVMYAKKFQVDEDKMMKRLWGDCFFNAAKKSFGNMDTSAKGKTLPRAFCQFIMTPIMTLMKCCAEGDAKWEKMATALGVELKTGDKDKKGKDLVKAVLSGWLNGAEAIEAVIIAKCPSPLVAQKYRIGGIYNGPADDEASKDMMDCNVKGKLMMNVVKMTPTGQAGRFYALGRVFAGEVKTDKVKIQLPGYDPTDAEASKGRLQECKLQSVVMLMGKDFIPVLAGGTVPAGNICAITGADQFIMKAATITEHVGTVHNFCDMKFKVSAVVRISVKPKDQKNLTKLVQGMQRLSKSDMLVICSSDESGEHVVSGCGDEHLKVMLKDLKEEHAGIDFTIGIPTVNHKETCVGRTAAWGKDENPALSKSPNKHNRLYVIAEGMEDDICCAIESHRINPQLDQKTRAKIMVNEFGWDKTDTLKIWGFGPAGLDVGGANVIVDQTKGLQYLNEIKESVNSGLLWASREGPLAEENMRGVRFNLMDAKLHTDSIHRGMGQIQPTARRVFYAALLTAEPRFLEPVFYVTIAAPNDMAGGVRQALNGKRGELLEETQAGPNIIITAHLPVVETIGGDPFSKVLQMKTGGKAFPTYAFDHWKLCPSDPLDGSSKSYNLLLEIRQRKGLKVELPDLAEYLDRL